MNPSANFMLYMTPAQQLKYYNAFKAIVNSGNYEAKKQLLNMQMKASNSLNISKLTVPKLKNLAKRRGIDIPPKMKKANIIRKLRGN